MTDELGAEILELVSSIAKEYHVKIGLDEDLKKFIIETFANDMNGFDVYHSKDFFHFISNDTVWDKITRHCEWCVLRYHIMDQAGEQKDLEILESSLKLIRDAREWNDRSSS